MNDNNMITVEQMVYVFNHNDEGYEFRSEDECALCWVENKNGWTLYIESATFFNPLEFDLTGAEIFFENGRFSIHLATGYYIRIVAIKRVEKIDFPSTEWAAKQIAND